MRGSSHGSHLRERASLVAAVAAGPVFLGIGYQLPGLMFRAAAGAFVLFGVIVVPLLTLAAGRLKFLAWQVAVVSNSLTVIADNLRVHAVYRREILSMAYVFWAGGTLLSSPLPIYFLLKLSSPRRRYLVGIMVGIIAAVLWLGIKRVTG
jgi:hypothetical protein